MKREEEGVVPDGKWVPHFAHTAGEWKPHVAPAEKSQGSEGDASRNL